MRLKDESGINIIKILRQNGYSFKILAFTMFHHENIMKECISAGANGYITKNIQTEKFVQALLDIIQSNEILIEDEKQEYIFIRRNEILSWDSNSYHLTKRELDFLRLCAQADLTYKQIADKLNISPKTADKFRESLFKKLNVKSKTEMVLYAKENGLI